MARVVTGAPVRLLCSKAQGLAACRALHAAGLPLHVVTLDDREDMRSALGPIRAFAETHGLRCDVMTSRSSARTLLAGHAATLQVVVGWYWLLDVTERATAALGTIGVHNSLLPAYRGGSPLVWAMLDGATEVGASIFTIGAGMDDGDVWAQVRTSVGPDEQIGEVLARLEPLATDALTGVVVARLDGRAESRPQDPATATLAAQRTPDDGVIDWRWSASRVHDFVRAQSAPYPGAFTFLGGRRLAIWRTARVEVRWRSTPGQIVAVEGERVLVGCGDESVLALLEVGDAVTRVPASTVLRSRSVRFPQAPVLLDTFPPATVSDDPAMTRAATAVATVPATLRSPERAG